MLTPKHIVLYLLSILIGAILTSCQNEVYPVAAVDPVKDITIVEDHSEFLIDWMKKGYKDMILVHLDEHDDFRYIPEYKIRQLKRLYQKKKWDEIESERDKAHGLYTIADFLYPAYKLGIIKKYYWIPTSDQILSEKIQENMRTFIASWDYSKEIEESFRNDGRKITGNIYGLDIEILSIRDLPEIQEPILLSIDIDYFADVIEESKAEELQVIQDIFSVLKQKKLRVRDVNIAYSTNGGHTPITDRHLCNEIKYCLEHPERVNGHTFPALWHVRNRGFHLIRNNKTGDALQLFNTYLAQHDNEPTLLLGKAISLAFNGDHAHAMNTISKLLTVNPEYDYVYIYIMEALQKRGETMLAKRYFSQYYKRHPDYYSWVYNKK